MLHSFTQRWYVAATLPRKEALAVRHLEQQGFKVLCPLLKQPSKVGRRIVGTLSPVFPGYVFVGFDPALARWRSVDGTRGVRGLIKGAEGPLAVRPGVIETLVRSMDGDGVLVFEPQLRPGEAARLRAGPFAGQLGVVETLDRAGRIRLLVSFLGRTTRVEAPVCDVQPVG